MKEKSLINDTVQEVSIVVVYNAASDQVMAFQRPSEKNLMLEDSTLREGDMRWTLEGQAIDTDGVSLNPLYSMPVYWFAWAATHPETELYPSTPSEGNS